MQERNYLKPLALALALVFAVFTITPAQKRRPAPKPTAPQITALLPLSDAIAIVKVRRALDDAVPKLLAGSPTKLAEVNAQVEQFKTRTGLDPRAFEEMAVSLRYTYPSEGVTKVHTVAVANGTFSSGAIVAAGRIASNGKYQEQQYHGKTIYLFNLNQQLKILGLFDIKVDDLAVAPLDTNVIALGDLKSVQDTIDVKRGQARGNAELIALASKDPNAILGFGANITPELLKSVTISNDAIASDLTAVRQVYGTAGVTDKDIETMIAARTVDAASAQNLLNTLEALRQFGSIFVNRLPGPKAALAKSALGNLKVTTQGNELQIRTTVGQAEIAQMVGR